MNLTLFEIIKLVTIIASFVGVYYKIDKRLSIIELSLKSQSTIINKITEIKLVSQTP